MAISLDIKTKIFSCFKSIEIYYTLVAERPERVVGILAGQQTFSKSKNYTLKLNIRDLNVE